LDWEEKKEVVGVVSVVEGSREEAVGLLKVQERGEGEERRRASYPGTELSKTLRSAAQKDVRERTGFGKAGEGERRRASLPGTTLLKTIQSLVPLRGKDLKKPVLVPETASWLRLPEVLDEFFMPLDHSTGAAA